MSKLKTLIKISRPRFWLYLAGPYLLGFTISTSSKMDFLSMKFLAPFIFFLLPANIILYGVNDLFDKNTDAKNPKKKSKENLLTTSQSHYLKSAVIVSFFLSLLPLLISNNIPHSFIFLIFLFLSYFYSSPPIRFKSLPFLDSLSNVLYGLPAVWGFMQNQNEIPSISVWIILFTWNAAMHLFSAIPDIKADEKANIKTTAVLLGENLSLLACAIFWWIFSFTVIYEGYLGSFGYLSLIYPMLPILLLVNKKMKVEKVYWYYPYINGFAGFFIFWFLALNNFFN